MKQTVARDWLDINEPSIHNKLFDKFGNRYNKVIVEEYQRNSASEWVKVTAYNSSENYYLLDGKLYWRAGDGLMPCEADFDNEQLNVCWKVVDIITDFMRITGNTILFENKYRRLKRQDYSDGTCFYTLHQWVEHPYPHYEKDFRVDEGADNLQKLIDYMSGQLSCSYEHLNQKWVQNSPIMKERTEEIIAKETELINFMKQLNTLSA